MITNLGFNSLQSFQGTKPQNTRPQSTRPQNTKSQGQEKDPNDILKAAALIGMLIAGGAGINCVSQIANTPKKSEVNYQEPTTKYVQQVEERPKAGPMQELELRWEEEGKKVAVSEAESERAEHESMMEAYQEAQNVQSIRANGVKYYLTRYVDFDNPAVNAAYKDVEEVFQNIGAKKIEKIVGAAGEYNTDLTGLLTVLVQQGGVPTISNAAQKDVAKTYGLDPDSTSKIDMFVAYYTICSEKAGGDRDKAAENFTGSKQDLEAYEKVVANLSGEQMAAIANNDAVAAYEASDYAD